MWLARASSIAIEKSTGRILKARMDDPSRLLVMAIEMYIKYSGIKIESYDVRVSNVDWNEITERVLTYVTQMQSGVHIMGKVLVGEATILLSGNSVEVRAPRRSGKTTWFNRMVDGKELVYRFGKSGTCFLTGAPFTVLDELRINPEKSAGVVVTVLTPKD